MSRPNFRIVDDSSRVDFNKVLNEGERQQCERWVRDHPAWRDWQKAVQREEGHGQLFYMLLYAEKLAITNEHLARQTDKGWSL